MGSPEWVMLLTEAATLNDVETCAQLVKTIPSLFTVPRSLILMTSIKSQFMDEALPWEEPYECHHCGHSGPYHDFEPGTDVSEATGAVESPSCNCCIWNDD